MPVADGDYMNSRMKRRDGEVDHRVPGARDCGRRRNTGRADGILWTTVVQVPCSHRGRQHTVTVDDGACVQQEKLLNGRRVRTAQPLRVIRASLCSSCVRHLHATKMLYSL